MQENADPEETVLWHYTTLDGLAGILQTKELWSTKFQFFNDKSEMISGLGAALAWLASHDRSDLRELASEGRFGRALANSVNRICVISFSEAKDSLSMWRGYSGAVTGDTGVAIGFRLGDLVQLSGGQIFEQPMKCEYWQPNENVEVFSDLEFPLPIIDAGCQVYPDISRRIPLVKNYHFHEEKEWRLVGRLLPHGPDMKLSRLTARGTRLAFKLDGTGREGNDRNVRPLAISEVMVGPKTRKDLVEDMLEGGFAQLGKGMPDISISDIPFV